MSHHDLPVADQYERDQALDPAQSFIVQAPAGSGKTELLIQRYLALLARVEAPEEIIALTFTRKAAAEMRNRVLAALRAAQSPAPEAVHKLRTWQLASAVLQRDREQDWNLEENPVRLSIQTIDSLCSGLTRQMPMLSRFGSQPAVVEDAEHLYRQAARQTLARLEAGDRWTEAIAILLRHLQNDLARAEKMLVAMLAKRDQWLRHIVSVRHQHIGRAELEHALVVLIEDTQTRLCQHIPPELAARWVMLADFAGSFLKTEVPDALQVACIGMKELPLPEWSQRAAWLGLAELVLTKQGQWRKRITKSEGFPAPSGFKDKAAGAVAGENKKALQQLITDLAGVPGLRMYLEELRMLPAERYSDLQWRVIDALVKLLPLAAAQLELVFQSAGQVDFTAVSQGAIRALGEADEPTDLALALDYRIQHLLIDEFQDTSLSQYELLMRLTSGWQPGDGRTLFAVGDPMQSIYRFRQAEVGRYLQARKEGIAGLKLTPLTLEVNFRSRPAIVDWVNRTFVSVFPDDEDPTLGAVTYSPSSASRDADTSDAVSIYPVADNGAEASKVVEIIQAIRQKQADAVIAVLVRSRSHLASIVPALRKAGLRFQALEIEPLGSRQVVQDVYALTRALMHMGDRVAWLAVLRAPWCGLVASDLLRLVEGARSATIWHLINDAQRLGSLSAQGRQNLKRVLDVLRRSMEQVQRQSLRSWVEQAWLRLGGPACIENETDLEDVEVYFSLLEQLERHGDLPGFADLQRGVESLWALPDTEADDGLQLMTIHKAKGLQFDHVILPGLHRSPRSSESQLLLWTERPTSRGGSDLLLAPVRADGSQTDPVYDYLSYLEKKRQRHEDARLLYVAATRAREKLYLTGAIPVKNNKDVFEAGEPDKNSLLNLLWHAVAGEFGSAFQEMNHRTMPAAAPDTGEGMSCLDVQGIRVLSDDWSCPRPAAPVKPTGVLSYAPSNEFAVEFEWAGDTARHVGTVVHRYLMHIASEGLEKWSQERIRSLAPAIRRQLYSLGVVAAENDAAVQRVIQALILTIEDERGRWLFDNRHDEACNEWPLSAWYRDELVNIVIDRSFVDSGGVRWIIDYKTSVHEESDVDAFLDREQERYRGQLQRYARILAAIENRPIRLGLYFPLLKGWREWSAEVE